MWYHGAYAFLLLLAANSFGAVHKKRNQMHYLRIVIALLLPAYLLSSCTIEEIPLSVSTPTERAAVATEIRNVTADSSPTATVRSSVPRATAVPLPEVAPVATLAPEITNALEEEQRLLVDLYRRINPSVVSIEVSGA